MKTIIIQVYAVNYRTEVLVDNKFAYQTGIAPNVERANLKSLVNLLGVRNVEITDKENV